LNQLVDHAAYRSDYQRALTGIRGVAALWVLLYHAWVYSTPRLIQFELAGIQFDITPLFSIGFVGVDLFFVLSAYLLGTRYFRWIEGRASRPALDQYFLRRVARVYPAYLLQLSLLLLIAATTSLYTMPGGTALLAHLFFYFNLPPLWINQLNGVWWTLPTEFYFYILLPLLVLLLRGQATRWLIVVVIAGSIAYRYWVFVHFHDLGAAWMSALLGNTLGYLDGFSLGLLASWLSVRLENRQLPPRLMDLLFVLGSGGILLSMWTLAWAYPEYWDGHPVLFLRNLMIAGSSCLVVMATRHGSPLAHLLLANRLIFFCGVVSYSLYLWHLPVIQALSKTSLFVDYTGYALGMYLIIATPLALSLAWLSYRFVELPFLRRPKTKHPPKTVS
jgi:peptidoglycan/LPS O-acetylase OafA/YrhL